MIKKPIYSLIFTLLILSGVILFIIRYNILGSIPHSSVNKSGHISESRFETKWGYTGSSSPEHWCELSNEYKIACKGKRQSPINITGTTDVDLPPLDLISQISRVSIENNGHTIEVHPKDSDNGLILEGKNYTLEQFHFHAPAENQIDGKTYPLEGHFVYKSHDGEITVLSVLYQYGSENENLKVIWKKMPQIAREEKELSEPISIGDFFPKNPDYYNFEGSLTTPPCTEGVNWIVFKNQENVHETQVKKFTETIGFNNNRPIQDLNGREIKE